MLTVHHLAVSQSDHIIWLCEELDTPYDLKRCPRDPVTNLAPADYRAPHPFGTAPIITDGEMVLAESGAIIEYLCAKAGGNSCCARRPRFRLVPFRERLVPIPICRPISNVSARVRRSARPWKRPIPVFR
jgi:glutathione S-transferase